MRVPGARVPYSLIVLYDSQMWTRAGWLRDGIQNKQEEKWEKNPAEHQTDVFAYSKVRSKYGVTGIAVSLTVALEVIFLGTYKAIVKRTSQVASVPKKMGYTGSQWEAEWLTHDNCSSNYCAFVLLLTTNSRLTLLGFYSCCLCHTMTSFTLSESERQRGKKEAGIKSRVLLWLPAGSLCSLSQYIFSCLRKRSEEWTDLQTDVPCRHPALLFLLLSDARPDAQGSKPHRINSHACSWIFLCMHTQAEEQCQKVDVSFMNPILIYGCILLFWLLTSSAVKALLWHLTNLCLSLYTAKRRQYNFDEPKIFNKSIQSVRNENDLSVLSLHTGLYCDKNSL